MNKETLRLLKSGRSIVSSLVDIGINAHRPLEAMTNEILSIHEKYAHGMVNKQAFLNYLITELKTAEEQYIKLVRSYQ